MTTNIKDMNDKDIRETIVFFNNELTRLKEIREGIDYNTNKFMASYLNKQIRNINKLIASLPSLSELEINFEVDDINGNKIRIPLVLRPYLKNSQDDYVIDKFIDSDNVEFIIVLNLNHPDECSYIILKDPYKTSIIKIYEDKDNEKLSLFGYYYKDFNSFSSYSHKRLKGINLKLKDQNGNVQSSNPRYIGAINYLLRLKDRMENGKNIKQLELKI